MGGLGSIELGCACVCKGPEEGGFTSVCVPDNAGLGSGTFGRELEVETTVGASCFLAVLARSESVLLCKGTASGDGERLNEL